MGKVIVWCQTNCQSATINRLCSLAKFAEQIIRSNNARFCSVFLCWAVVVFAFSSWNLTRLRATLWLLLFWFSRSLIFHFTLSLGGVVLYAIWIFFFSFLWLNLFDHASYFAELWYCSVESFELTTQTHTRSLLRLMLCVVCFNPASVPFVWWLLFSP